MANVISGKKVAKGNVLIVANEEKTHNNAFCYRRQADEYVCIHVEDINGKNENVLLITAKEFGKCRQLILPVIVKDALIAGRLYPCVINGLQKYMIKLVEIDGSVTVRTMSMIRTSKWKERAANHVNSVPKKSRWADLFD